MSHKRKSNRYPVYWSAECVHPSGIINSYVVDLSLDGLKLASPVLLRVGDIMNMRVFYSPKAMFYCTSEIVRYHLNRGGKNVYGARIQVLGEENTRLFSDALREVRRREMSRSRL